MRWRHWRFTAPLRLRPIFRRHRADDELNEELQFHLEQKIEEGLARGLTPGEAQFAAVRAMDGMEQRKEEARDMRQIHWLTDFLAYNVNRKTREIGIRTVIGAQRWDVLRLVMNQGIAVVSIGTVLGVVMGLAAERLLNTMFSTSRVDFVAYAIVVPLLFLITMLAAYIPARRASRIEPTRALRYE